MALDNGPRPATALIARGLRAAMRVFAIATLTVVAVPLFAQGTSDPAVLAQQALAKCEQAFLACAKTCVGATCEVCEQIRTKCKADVNSTIKPKPPVLPGGTTGTPGKGVPPPPSPTPTPPPPLPDCSKLGEGATCENDQCKECRKGKCVSIAAQPLAKSKAVIGKKIKPIRSASKKKWANPSDPWGLAYVERINPTISARCEKGVWRVIVTGISGDYSILARLVKGVKEVTGPKGNTTNANFCAQVEDLQALGGSRWYMVKAVEAHEAVHAKHMLPALVASAKQIEALFTKLEVPITPGKTRAQAIAELKALPAYKAAQEQAYNLWLQKYLAAAGPDHGTADNGPAYKAEYPVVNPMIKKICDHARTSKWPACAYCPKASGGGGSW